MKNESKNRTRILSLVLFLPAMVPLFHAQPARALGPSMMGNGSFEGGTLGFWGADADPYSVVNDPANAHSGSWVVKAGFKGWDTSFRLREPLSLWPNTSYTCSVWCKGNGTVKLSVEGLGSATGRATSSWQQITLKFNTGKIDHAVNIDVGTVGGSGSLVYITVFLPGKGIYYEARMACADLAHIGKNGWAGFWSGTMPVASRPRNMNPPPWSMSVENMPMPGWPGKWETIENDIMEYNPSWGHPRQFDSTLHDWSSAKSGNVGNFNSLVCPPAGADYTQWHTYGQLWIPATNPVYIQITLNPLTTPTSIKLGRVILTRTCDAAILAMRDGSREALGCG